LDAGFEVGWGYGKGFAETVGVEGGDLEDAVAALGAAGAAGEVRAGAGDGGGQGGVEDLDEGGGHAGSFRFGSGFVFAALAGGMR
jgi:hypothetical protein